MKNQRQYQTRRNIYCWLGFILGIVGNSMTLFGQGFGYMLLLTALILSVVGCYNWSMSKARYPMFCLWGLLAPIGFLGLAFLEDRYWRPSKFGDTNSHPDMER